MNRLRIDDPIWPSLGIAALFVAMIGLMCALESDFRSRCRAHGGIVIHGYHNEPICMPRGSVIDLEAP